MKTLEQHQSEIEDLLDGIIAESRKGEPAVSWEEAKKHLRQAGKL